jgi:hypothetical protein
MIAMAALCASALLVAPPSSPDRRAADKFLAECSTTAKIATPACQAIAHDVNRLALRMITVSEIIGRPLDKEFLRNAARSTDGGLRAAAIRALGREPMDKVDQALVLQALSSPFPGVRSDAAVIAAKLSDPAISDRLARTYDRTPRASVLPYVADKIPTASSLGGDVYPGATYDHLASGPRRAFFTTSDPPDKVVAFYAKGGKTAQTMADLQSARTSAGQPNPAEIMRRIQRGEDPQKVIADIQAQAMRGASSDTWTKAIEGERGVENPRFIELVPAVVPMRPGVVPAPAKIVIVFTDLLLRRTAILFPIAERRDVAAFTGTIDADQIMREQEALRLPLPTTPGTDPTK